jgi:hypothetical protein
MNSSYDYVLSTITPTDSDHIFGIFKDFNRYLEILLRMGLGEEVETQRVC